MPTAFIAVRQPVLASVRSQVISGHRLNAVSNGLSRQGFALAPSCRPSSVTAGAQAASSNSQAMAAPHAEQRENTRSKYGSVSAKKISPRMAELMVKQANREIDASRLYLSMSLWFQFNEFDGSAAWCRAHSAEENGHAMMIFDHLAKRETHKACTVETSELSDFTMNDFTSDNCSAVWRMALDQERGNTQQYYEMMDVALEERDHVSRQFLDWFINEQLEEEDALDTLVSKAERVEQTDGLYMQFDEQIPKNEH